MSSSGKYIPGNPERAGFYSFARFVLSLILPFLFKFDVQGAEHIPENGAVLLASNHFSGWDIIATAFSMKRMLHFMAKSEYTKSRFLTWLFTHLEAFFVNRGEGDTEAIRNCLAVLKAQQALIIYPEGHRSEDHALLKAHEGFALIALKSGAPVVPVAVWGSELVLRKGYRWPHRPVVHIRFGQPMLFPASGKKYTRADMQSATDDTMRAIAAALPEKYRGAYAALPDSAAAQKEPVGSEE